MYLVAPQHQSVAAVIVVAAAVVKSVAAVLVDAGDGLECSVLQRHDSVSQILAVFLCLVDQHDYYRCWCGGDHYNVCTWWKNDNLG